MTERRKFEELSNEAKEHAKNRLVEMICTNRIPTNLRFNTDGDITSWEVFEIIVRD